MRETDSWAVAGSAFRQVERALLCPAIAFASMALAACETCVEVKVALDQAPVEGAYVELLDEQGARMREGWTSRDGEYCFSKLRFGRSLTLRSTLDSRSLEAAVDTGSNPGSCRRGACQTVESSFPCEPADPLEPNDGRNSASEIQLPYSNPLAALCPQGDVDFYRVDINVPGMSLIANVGDSVAGGSFYRRVGLFDTEGNRLAHDSGSSMRVASPVPGAGTYYVAVTHGYDHDFAGEHDQYGAYAIDIRIAASSCIEVLVGENGVAVQGARVRMIEYPYEDCDTDASGTCCFPAYVGVESRYEVQHPDTWESLVVAVSPGNPGDCGQGDCEEVTVDFDYTCVTGTVSRGGQPVANVRVWGPYGDTNTDQGGTYCVRSPKNQIVYVTVEDSGLCSAGSQGVETLSDGSCTEGGCSELDFELPALSCVSGTVTRDGEPVEGAWVHPSHGCSPPAPAGPDGTFCLVVPEETALVLTVWDPLFFDSRQVEVESGQGGSCGEGGCSEVEVQLTGRTCVSGTVSWQDGGPAEDMRVYGPAGEARSGSDGRYCLVAPEDREISIAFYDPVYASYRSWDVRTGEGGSCEGGGCSLLDALFPATSCISGVVSREGGEPPYGVALCLGWDDYCVEPAADGGYCLRAPVDGSARLLLRDPVTETWEERDVETGPEGTCSGGDCLEVSFELPPTACVRGFVTREGEPEEGARVCLGHGGDFCILSGPDGEYCLPTAAASTVSVRVEDPVLGEERYGWAETGPFGSCDTADCSRVDLDFPGATCISGVVREGTEPLEGASVWNPFGRVYTNEEGRYCLPALSNETEWIRAGHPADGSEIVRYPLTNNGGRCDEGGCTIQNFTFD